jgi:hypothetical protein
VGVIMARDRWDCKRERGKRGERGESERKWERRRRWYLLFHFFPTLSHSLPSLPSFH